MLIVVGGHSRNIGKTSVVAGLIAALPQARWTALKITQHGHGVCSAVGEPCDCAVEYDHPYAISEETGPSSTDSGRYLGAGASRAFWLRTAQGQLGHAIPAIRRLLDEGGNCIVESNSLLDFVSPDLYVAVLDYSVADMKDSARRHLPRANALVTVHRGPAPWHGVPERWLAGKPIFEAAPPVYVSKALATFAGEKLQARREDR
ncbi:MAG: hypothetical protein R2762_02935 [Bryobacteraceae bacterium]